VHQVIRELELEGLVWVTGHVSAELFYALIDAADICIQLRYPSAGEMSSAILRVMSRGKAVLVSDYEQFSEFPDACCLKVDLGSAEIPLLTSYLHRLAEDPSLRQRLGDNARRHVSTHHNVEETVRGYLRVLEDVAGRPPAAPRKEEPMDESQHLEEWVDVPALMAAIRRELARQEGQLAAPDWERFRTLESDWLMEDIRNALARRWHAGELIDPDLRQYRSFDSIPEELEKHIKFLKEHQDKLYEPLSVRSRTPLLGKVWADIRRHIHEEVRSYLDPMVWRQSELNAAVINSLEALAHGFYSGSLARSLQALYLEIVELRRQVRSLEDQLRAAGSPPPEDVP
jgi:hypothetical protein